MSDEQLLGDTPIISTKGLRKMYGPHLALDDINLEIKKGSIGILGPNGAGKSTLFKCLLGRCLCRESTSCFLLVMRGTSVR